MKALILSALLAAGVAVIAWTVYSTIDTSAKQMGNGVDNNRFGDGGVGSNINRAGKVRWDF